MNNIVRATGAMPNLEWFISLFKSKHHRRIEKKIDDLNKERIVLGIRCKLFKKYSTAQITDFIIRRNQLDHDIELIKTLLK